MKTQRPALREQYIRQGLLTDAEARSSLKEAINFRGTCQDMCPEYERYQREYERTLDKLELLPGTSDRVDHARAVKMYHRSAAGDEQPLPSDVRPPKVLLKTLDYLINEILAKYPLEECHSFLRDRTRSIRQDFTLQNYRHDEAVVAHEMIARYHIIAMHWMRSDENFAIHQEMEQLRKGVVIHF